MVSYVVSLCGVPEQSSLTWVILVFEADDQDVSDDIRRFTRLEQVRSESLVEVDNTPEQHDWRQQRTITAESMLARVYSQVSMMYGTERLLPGR